MLAFGAWVVVKLLRSMSALVPVAPRSGSIQVAPPDLGSDHIASSLGAIPTDRTTEFEQSAALPPAGFKQRLLAIAAQLSLVEKRGSIIVKLKHGVSFYQVVTEIPKVYMVSLPPWFTTTSNRASFVNLNPIAIGLHLQCWGLSSFFSQLLFLAMAPIFLAMALVAKEWCSGDVRKALPFVIKLTFIVFPSVSSQAFLTFLCQSFEDAKGEASFMRADFSVTCTIDGVKTSEYQRIKALATAVIVIYPVGIPILYAFLLYISRRGSPLGRALSFLTDDYDPSLYWWELIEKARKLLLVGFAALVAPGSVSQLLAGTLVQISFTIVAVYAQPYAEPSNSFFSLGAQTCLIFVFLCIMMYDQTEMVEGLGDRIPSWLKNQHTVSRETLAVMLAGSTAAVLLCLVALVVHQTMQLSYQPRLRWLPGKQLVIFPAPPRACEYHLFISYAWHSAQDQARTLKWAVCSMVPGLRVWLDLDYLHDVRAGALESSVSQCGCVLVFLSAGYFESASCLRELRAAVRQGKPLVMVHEKDEAHGSRSLDQLRQACPAELREPLFENAPSVSWYRSPSFQLVSTRQILAVLLQDEAEARGLRTCTSFVYAQGERGQAKCLLPMPSARPLIYVSPCNSGAKEVAEELVAEAEAMNYPRIPPVYSEEDPEAEFFLLYLNGKTFPNPDLAAELTSALEREQIVVLAHECDEQRHAAPFGAIIDQTPPELIRIFEEIAIALHTSEHRTVGLRLLADRLGSGKSEGEHVAARRISPVVRTRPQSFL